MPSAKSTSKSVKSKNTKSTTSSDKPVEKKIASDNMMNNNVSPAKKIEELYSLVEGIDIAMLTSRTFDGTLVSRPMATQEKRPRVDFWFVTSTETHKVDELQAQPEVNLAYYNNKSREWVSVSGTARLISDRDLIRTLYKPDWKAWFGDEGGDHNGGPNDPRLVLIEVEAHEATYLKSNQPRAVQLFKVAKALLTGTPPKIGDMRHVGKKELEARR
ncbi:MAG TPA: pyridoxamine 5'-phosphate oxidase family protein [Gemmatimonadaceae bacterium]|jgi:general stress protein 26|nr:pyridoxamine 5'-phosphate oxidase family protein [Gemmatimonadaceae bacterium]